MWTQLLEALLFYKTKNVINQSKLEASERDFWQDGEDILIHAVLGS